MKRLVIEFESSREDEKKIIDRVSLAAIKSLKSSNGSLVCIRRADPIDMSSEWRWEREIETPDFMNR